MKLNEINPLIYKRTDKSIDKFQLQFVFKLNNPEHMNDTLDFSISGIALNDPCVDENMQQNFCNNRRNLGTCERYFVPQPIHRCKCKYYATGDECELIDYCLRDNGINFCMRNNFGLCKNSEDQFECSCQHGQRWFRSMRTWV